METRLRTRPRNGKIFGLVEFLPISGLGSNPSLGYPTHHREVGLQVRFRPFR